MYIYIYIYMYMYIYIYVTIDVNVASEFWIFNFKNKTCLVFKVQKKFYGYSQGLSTLELPQLTRDRF